MAVQSHRRCQSSVQLSIANIDEGLKSYYKAMGVQYNRHNNDGSETGKFAMYCEDNGYNNIDLLNDEFSVGPQDCILVDFAYDPINEVYNFPFLIASYPERKLIATGFIKMYHPKIPNDIINLIASWYQSFECHKLYTKKQKEQYIFDIIKHIHENNGKPPEIPSIRTFKCSNETPKYTINYPISKLSLSKYQELAGVEYPESPIVGADSPSTFSSASELMISIQDSEENEPIANPEYSDMDELPMSISDEPLPCGRRPSVFLIENNIDYGDDKIYEYCKQQNV